MGYIIEGSKSSPAATAAVGIGFVLLFMLVTGGFTKLAIDAVDAKRAKEGK